MRRLMIILVGVLAAGGLAAGGGCVGPAPGEVALSSLGLDGLESAYRQEHERAPVGSVSSRAKSVRAEAVKRYASWSPRERRAVMDGRIWAGATREQAWWAWGPPSRTERSKRGVQLREAWFYDISRVSGSASIYQREIRLHDGRVVRWSAEQ